MTRGDNMGGTNCIKKFHVGDLVVYDIEKLKQRYTCATISAINTLSCMLILDLETRRSDRNVIAHVLQDKEVHVVGTWEITKLN